MFNFMRQQVRLVLRESSEDYFYIGFVEHWNEYVEQQACARKVIRQSGAASGQEKEGRVERIAVPEMKGNMIGAVSYTHLTLPTIYSV